MPKIYFIRHGQTDWNAEARLQGTTNIPLNQIGQEQATRNGQTLAGLVDNPETYDFVASPLDRTRETMRLVRAAMDLEPDDFRHDENLVEVGFGDWEGKRWVELHKSDPAGVANYLTAPLHFAPPNGEGYGGAQERAIKWLKSVTQDTIVVSHGGISRCLRGYLLDIPEPDIVQLKVPQDQIMEIVYTPDVRDFIWH